MNCSVPFVTSACFPEFQADTARASGSSRTAAFPIFGKQVPIIPENTKSLFHESYLPWEDLPILKKKLGFLKATKCCSFENDNFLQIGQINHCQLAFIEHNCHYFGIYILAD